MAFGYLTPLRRGYPAARSTGGSLFDLNRQINRMFDDLFDQDGDSGFYARAGMAAPAMDIHQDDNQVEITAELPGVKEDDIDITIDDGILTLRGEKKCAREDEQTGYRERSYGSFERRITLPANIDEDRCSAEFKDGVLTLTLPKSAEKARGRKIKLGQGKQRDTRAEDSLIEQREGAKSESKKREKESA